MKPTALQTLARFQAFERFRCMNARGGTDWSRERQAALETRLRMDLGDVFNVLRMITVLDHPGFPMEEALLPHIEKELAKR